MKINLLGLVYMMDPSFQIDVIGVFGVISSDNLYHINRDMVIYLMLVQIFFFF
jgi:hypothetical protein